MAIKDLIEGPLLGSTARLIRGRHYMFGGKTFPKDVDVPVSEKMADYLADEKLVSRDSRSDELVERRRFKVTRIEEAEAGDISLAKRAVAKKLKKVRSVD